MEPRVNERFDPFIRMVPRFNENNTVAIKLGSNNPNCDLAKKEKKMAKIIQRTLATAFVSIAVLPLPPAFAQTQQQLNWCLHKDDAFSPVLRIDGCTASIKSGHQS